MTAFPHPLPLRTDGEALGLRRIAVPTSVGTILAHTGRERGGPAIVLLHGAAGSWTTWTPMLAASDILGTPLTDVIALDLPGWGESDGIARVHRVEDLGDGIVEVVRALGYTSWRLVGHSLGGFVALDIAARYSAQTLGVTTVSASGASVLGAIRRPVRGAAALPGFAGMLALMRVLAVSGSAGAGLVRLLGRLGWLSLFTAPLFVGGVHPSVIEALGSEVRPAAFAHAARLAADYEERTWTAITCSVRAVRGVRDVFAGEQDAGAFLGLIDDFCETRLADAGHFAHAERPEAVLAAIAAATPVPMTPRTAFRAAA